MTRLTGSGATFSTTTYSYDALNRLTNLVNTNGANAVVSGYLYQLRADGKRSNVVESGPSTSGSQTTYAYDDAGRLTQESGSYGTVAYTYDNVGNRLTRTVSGSTSLANGQTVSAYDANDRLTSGVHSYDADGNELSVNGQAASYDFENHLIGLSGGTSYTYDADGSRVGVTTGGVTTSYLVDASLPYASVVEEYSGSTLSARYDYGDDLVRMDRAGGVYYYLYDGLGSTRQLVGMNGSVTDSYSYDAFGTGLSRTGSTVNPFLFNAQQFDGASGDYYLRARYYDQSNGRFLSQDPVSGDNNNPTSLHRYLYASNDPLTFIDPSGKSDTLASLSFVIAIGTLLGATVALNYHHDKYLSALTSESNAGSYLFPNIKDELVATLGRVYRAWNKPENSRYHAEAGAALSNPLKGALGAWDIIPLYHPDFDKWVATATNPNLSLNDEDQRMVRVDGETFHTYTINYVIFGEMMQLAGYSRQDVDDEVTAAKATRNAYLDVAGAIEWAEAGYDGWPNGALTPASEIKSKGDSGLSVPPFSVHWERFGPNNAIYFDGSVK